MGKSATEQLESEFPGTERFVVERRLGAGAMGVVYQVFDRELQASLALKTLRQIDAQSLYRFKNEFRALQGIAHPNLVRLGELISADALWFFTMELIEGVDFLEHVRSSSWVPPPARESNSDTTQSSHGAHGHELTRPTMTGGGPTPADGRRRGIQTAADLFDEVKLRAALAQLVQGIAALHDHGKVHRDIKPSNILVTEEGRVVLLDFGIIADLAPEAAAEPSATGSGSSSVIEHAGTAAFMAPEQAIANPVSAASDWYSLGAVIYFALVGRPPFRGTTAQILMNKQRFEPPAPAMLVAGVPQDLNDLCVELLRFDPRARPSRQEIFDRLGVDHAQTMISTGTMPSQFTQTSRFVGREQELAALNEAFRGSASRAEIAVVHGPSGVGKSELVRRFCERVENGPAPAVVFAGRCYERESVPYKALDGVADSLCRYFMQLPEVEAQSLLPERAGLLPQLFPVLGRVEVMAAARDEQSAALDPQEQRRRRFRALRELLVNLAEVRRTVLVIDDFQWADPDSMMLLREVLRAPNAPRVLLLAILQTSGEQGEEAAADLAGQLRWLPGHTRRIAVGPLARTDAIELVRSLSPQLALLELDAAAAIVGEAGGHPLFILELVRHAEEMGTLSGEGGLRLDDALTTRIRRLSNEAQLLLQVLAVAGAPITQDVARHAAELDHGTHQKAVALLRVAFFARTSGARGVDAVEVYNNRVGAAVLAGLDEPTRRHRHARIAAALERAGAGTLDPHALVRHLAGAGEADRAARYARDSAERATRALAFDQAAELYRTALQLGHYDDEQTRALRLRRGRALVNAGRGPEAAEEFLTAAEGADPTTHMDCQRQATEQLLISGHIARGLEIVRELLSQVGVRFPESRRRALLSLLWSRARLRLRGLGWKPRHAKEVPAAELMRLEVFRGMSHGLGLVDPIRGMDFQARGLLLALRVGEPDRVASALFYEACFLGGQGRKTIPRARRLLEEGMRIEKTSHDPYIHGWRAAGAGFVGYFSSAFPQAADDLGKADEFWRANTSGASWELSSARQFRLQSLWHMGAFAKMRQLFDEYIGNAAQRGDRYTEITIRRSCNLLWLVDDDVEAARGDLQQRWPAPDESFHLQHYYELRARAEIALYEDEAAAALDELAPMFDSLFKSLLMRVQMVRASSLQIRARLLLSAAQREPAPPAGAMRQVARMARRLDRERMGYASVWAAALRAGAAAVAGDRARLLAHLGNTLTLGRANSMMAFAWSAGWHLGRLTGGDEGVELIERAEEWMEREGIRNRAGLLRVFTPGIPLDEPSRD